MCAAVTRGMSASAISTAFASRARAQSRVDGAGERQEPERDERADEVVTGRDPGVRLEEVVVDDVERDDRECEPRHPSLG